MVCFDCASDKISVLKFSLIFLKEYCESVHFTVNNSIQLLKPVLMRCMDFPNCTRDIDFQSFFMFFVFVGYLAH